MRARSAASTAAVLGLVAAAVAAVFWGYPGNSGLDTRSAEASASSSDRTQNAEASAQRLELEVVQPADKTTVRPAYPETVAIAFPDGSRSVIAVRRPSPPEEMPDGRLLDHYEALRVAALSGDGSAAEMLFRGLDYCRMAYADTQALDAAIRVLREGRLLKLADGSPPTAIDSADDVDVVAENVLRASFEYCKGITTEQKSEAGEWLDLAARQGNFHAIRTRAGRLGFTEDALQAWQEAWKAGDGLALEFLGKIHSKGTSSLPGGAPDHVRAYAYTLLSTQLLEALHANSPPGYFRRMVGRYQARLTEEGAYLNPQEYDEAIALAKEMLAASPNCCFVN